MKFLLALCVGTVLCLAAPVGALSSSSREGGRLRGRAVRPVRCRVTGQIFEAGEGGIQLVERVSAPHHIVIETPKTAIGGLRAAIQNASADSFQQRPRLTFITFDSDSGIERSPHGVPVLRSMFLAAMEQFPKADTYTYFNSDIAVDSSFLTTADAVVQAVGKGTLRPRFLVVGKRTNVNWAESMQAADEEGFMQVFKGGKLFRPDAEDYFMVSRSTFDWAAIPPFIVGHRGFDNWLVSEALLKRGVDLVSATATLHAMHMTDERVGNHEGASTESADGADYNMLLMGKTGGFQNISWICGATSGAEWATRLDSASRVEFVSRPRRCPH